MPMAKKYGMSRTFLSASPKSKLTKKTIWWDIQDIETLTWKGRCISMESTGSLQSVESYESDHLMVKFAPDGTLIWDAPVQLSVTPVKGFGDIQFDAANNMYISAVFDNSAKFYTPGSTEFQTVNMPGTFGSKP